MLCDTAQGYTQSHSDKPDCVRNDYSSAIARTPPNLDLAIAIHCGSCAEQPFDGEEWEQDSLQL